MPQAIRTIQLGNVNCYLIKTDAGYILIDTGFANQRAALEKELEMAGCLPGNLRLILLTHGDADHTGNGAYLRKKYKTTIAMHPNDACMVEKGEVMMDSQRNRKVRPFLPRIRFNLILIFFGAAFRKVYADFEEFKPDQYLTDGQSLKEFAFDAKVICLPGHTSGSIGILTQSGDLICGDTVVNRGKPIISPSGEDFAELEASVQKLKGLDAKTVYPGHGQPFLMEQFMRNS